MGGGSPIGNIVNAVQTGIDIAGAINDCNQGGFSFSGRTVGSVDPNDKVGSPGVGVPRYVNGDTPFPYIIHFENQATATAPAQEVVITDQLDVTKFDLNTFSFGDVTIGNLRLAVLPNKRDFNKDFDLRPSNNIIARINAKLDMGTGLITWRFQSIDPATGLPTNDPLAGILPPNTTPPRGEGSVMFTVKVKSNLVTGAEIRNQARIVFDTNAPIDTPEWLNTLDNSPPSSRVQALPSGVPYSFVVTWSGTDTGSGINSYTISVSDNGGAYTPWLVNTASPNGVFTGQNNHTYRFYSIARDAAGNEESAKTVPEATTTVSVSAALNPLDDATFFVSQQYRDFLAREPDASGFTYWTGQITSCGTSANCIHFRRIGVSAAFFVELEFQQTGSVIYRLYRASYGTLPGAPSRANVSYTQFRLDRSQLVGGPQLPQSTLDFANRFVVRTEFTQAYPASQTPTEFVNKLFDTASLTPFTAERQQAIAALTNGTKTRAQVLLDLIEINAFKTREYNPSFVLMQYFGYLRRDPDQGGYDFWLNVLNTPPNGVPGMVCAFITSREYQERFSTVVTRSNADCTPGGP